MRNAKRGKWFMAIGIFALVFAFLMAKDYFGWEIPMLVEGIIAAVIALGVVGVLSLMGFDPFDTKDT